MEEWGTSEAGEFTAPWLVEMRETQVYALGGKLAAYTKERDVGAGRLARLERGEGGIEEIGRAHV